MLKKPGCLSATGFSNTKGDIKELFLGDAATDVKDAHQAKSGQHTNR